MRIKLAALAILLLANIYARAQYVFLVPSYFHGIFSDQLSSARAQGMGYTTITLDGISTAIYNPATISPGKTKLDLGLNYAKGNPTMPKSYYPFAGISFKPLPKLSLGATMFAWIDPDSYWTASIANVDIDTKKKSQHMYSLMAAYEFTKGLHVGVSGNFIKDEAVEGTTTAKEFLVSAGAIYDLPVSFIKSPKIINQNLRFAASLVNVLMNGRAEEKYKDLLNYRDVPIILRGGLAYDFSIPVSVAFAKNKKFFKGSPEILDITLRMQYQDWLKSKEHIFFDHKSSNAFGIGTEAWFMHALAFRLGYYYETRPGDVDPGQRLVTEDKKRGFTWGLGANLPLQRLTAGKMPFDIEVNIVSQRMMNEVIDERALGDIKDRRFQFCMGLNIKWKGR
jgi:hypothetical protein